MNAAPGARGILRRAPVCQPKSGPLSPPSPPSPTRRAPRWPSLATALAAAALLFTGCLRSQPAADLTIVNGPEPESLDPHILTGQADGRVAEALFEGLTRYNPETGRAMPGLAERWDISPDGRTYLFHLRTNAVWSTGGPITAEDFVYSWRRALDPATACEYAGNLFYVKNARAFNAGKLPATDTLGVHAEDSHTLRVDLEGPTAFFLDLCAFWTLAAVPRELVQRYGDRWMTARPFAASGAYVLESWRLNDRIRLRKNPRYWDAANTHSEIVDLLPCISPTTALNLYITGAADVVWDKELVPVDLLDVLLKRPDFHSYDYLGNYFFRFNVTRKPFDDPRVRRALALVIDKDRLVRKITKAGERVATCLSPPGIANGETVYHPPAGLPYDPPAGRRLLAEAGFPDGKGFPSFVYLMDTQKTHEKIAIELQEMWQRELGIHVELRQLEWKAYLRAQYMLEYDACRSSWIGDYDDPNTFLDLFMSDNPNNRTGWRNAHYDQLITEANQQTSSTAREKILQTAEGMLLREEVPIVPLFFYAGIEYFSPDRISGVHANLLAEHPIRAIEKHPVQAKPRPAPAAATHDRKPAGVIPAG